jgi:hypothetical protein
MSDIRVDDMSGITMSGRRSTMNLPVCSTTTVGSEIVGISLQAGQAPNPRLPDSTIVLFVHHSPEDGQDRAVLLTPLQAAALAAKLAMMAKAEHERQRAAQPEGPA